ncbi:MAG: chromate transporter [Chitinophagia bacterium]
MKLLRHIPFLTAVLKHSITAFGGPQVHLGLMQHRFVDKRKDITSEELMEYNAFCQLLPGASSTQTIILIAFKRGGISLAFFTLLVWILPATFLMTMVAIAYNYFDMRTGLQSFILLQPMAIGFIVSATIVLYKKAINSLITKIIFILTAIFIFLAFKSPWAIPVVILIAGMATNFSQKRIPNDGAAPKTVNWGALFIFIFLFLAVGILSEEATRKNWEQHKVINVFENNYRFGSFVFGGGDVLIPMMYEQYVARPNSDRIKKNKRDVLKISKEAFLMGAGMVRAMPGPVFSVASYTSAMALKEKSIAIQIGGALLGSLGIFLPSFFIVLFFFPIWQNLKKYAIFYRSLEGIYAAVVGIMLGATLYFLKDISVEIQTYASIKILSYIFVFLTSTYLIYTQKIAAQWIVLGTIAFGFLLTSLNI